MQIIKNDIDDHGTSSAAFELQGWNLKNVEQISHVLFFYFFLFFFFSNTSSDHGGLANSDNSANWLKSIFLGRNMTTLGAIFLAALKRKYLHKFIAESQQSLFFFFFKEKGTKMKTY